MGVTGRLYALRYGYEIVAGCVVTTTTTTRSITQYSRLFWCGLSIHVIWVRTRSTIRTLLRVFDKPQSCQTMCCGLILGIWLDWLRLVRISFCVVWLDHFWQYTKFYCFLIKLWDFHIVLFLVHRSRSRGHWYWFRGSVASSMFREYEKI